MVQHEDPDRRELAHGMPAGMPIQYYSNDEISLFDLWDVLIRRWYWIVGILLVTVLLGLAYALMRVDAYEYTYTIEIGERLVGDDLTPISSPNGSVAKLQNNYIPAAIRSFLNDNPDIQWRPEISASPDSDTGIVILRATGPVERRESLITIMENAGQQLKQDHSRRLNVFSEQLEVESNRAESRVEAFDREIDRLQEQLVQVRARKEQFTAEVEELERQLSDVRSGERSGDPEQAVSYLMLVDRLRDARGRLDELQFDLGSRIEEARREREETRGKLDILETRQRNLTETAVLSDPQQSLQPVGTGKTVIVALSLVLGGMLGVFAAFFAEFVHAANRRRREAEADDSGSVSQDG